MACQAVYYPCMLRSVMSLLKTARFRFTYLKKTDSVILVFGLPAKFSIWPIPKNCYTQLKWAAADDLMDSFLHRQFKGSPSSTPVYQHCNMCHIILWIKSKRSLQVSFTFIMRWIYTSEKPILSDKAEFWVVELWWVLVWCYWVQEVLKHI